MNYSKLILVLALVACCSADSELRAQTVAPAATDPTATSAVAPEKEETIVLSPFTVTTDKDRGYLATNSTSGTRLNTPIKDLPMPIEVITSQFMDDIGARDLRQALSYSSGILLQTQNDYGAAAGGFSTTPGKINNPEGLTASPDQTHMKIRGFQTASVLRDGFRRQNSSDAVNIDRVEVARGPASLLYGVGNFGGVVNYMTKKPLRNFGGETSFTYGSDDFKRATIDVTGPLAQSGSLAYRVTGAVQDTNSYTDFNSEKHVFVSPVITWTPSSRTELLLDVEYGRQKQKGIGWQNLRAAVTDFISQANGYNGQFYTIPGKDPRTFRWSGPDTYRDSTASNVELKLTQRLTDNINLLVGYNRSSFKFDQLDNLAGFKNPPGTAAPAWAIAPVTFKGLVSTQTNVPVGPQPTTILYQWQKEHQSNTHNQWRAELNYNLKLFQNSSKWLRMDHSFLVGLSYTHDYTEDHIRQTAGDVVNYHSPSDYSYFRYGKQGDGSPDRPMVEWDNLKNTTVNPAFYGVYQGKLLNDRLTVIAGMRRDRSWNKEVIYNPEYNLDGTPHGDTAPRNANSLASRDTTHQYGLSLKLTNELSAYVMRSDGVEPNYQGKLDLNGNSLQAALAVNKEVGLKFDLFDGKVSGTISRFEITRTRAQVGSSSLIWFAPVAAAKQNFNPAKDIVYKINDLNPHDSNNSWNGAVAASTPQWDAAVAAGAVYQATNSGGNTNWYVNASKATGAKFMDTLFSNVVAQKQQGWWGWIYDGSDPGFLPFDNLVNNATMDDNGAQKSVPTGSDRASGWDTQIIFSPTKDLQFLLSFAKIEKVVLNAQSWPKYPYPQDRWAIWYAPISWSATAGRPLNEAYTNPEDTSTFVSFGSGLPLDDTPKYQASFWGNYQFPKNSSLSGFSLGAGGSYEGKRQVYPAYGQNALDVDGNTIFLSTRSRVNINAMIKYAFKLHNHDASVQLNVDNVVNDRKLYGFVYAAPRKFQLQFETKF